MDSDKKELSPLLAATDALHEFAISDKENVASKLHMENFVDVLTVDERRSKENLVIMEKTGATLQDIQEYREIFELVDIDKGGSIDASELRKLTDLLNMDTSEEELDDMMAEIDTTGDGEIYFPDFVACMLTRPSIDYTAEDVLQSFATLAGPAELRTRTGYIEHTTLEEMLMNVGNENEKLSKEKVDEVLGLVEVDDQGMVKYAEFVNLMMGGSVGDSAPAAVKEPLVAAPGSAPSDTPPPSPPPPS
jgi:calmodulin